MDDDAIVSRTWPDWQDWLDWQDWIVRIGPAALLAAAIGFAVAQLGSVMLAPAFAAGGFVAAYNFLSCEPAEADLAVRPFDPAPLAFGSDPVAPAMTPGDQPRLVQQHVGTVPASVSPLSGALAALRRSLHQGASS